MWFMLLTVLRNLLLRCSQKTPQIKCLKSWSLKLHWSKSFNTYYGYYKKSNIFKMYLYHFVYIQICQYKNKTH